MTKLKQTPPPSFPNATADHNAKFSAFHALAKRTAIVIVLMAAVALLFFPKGVGIPFCITLFLMAALIFTPKALYIFYPDRFKFPEWQTQACEWRAKLERHQQLYLNLLLLIPVLAYVKVLNSPAFIFPMFVSYFLFALWIVLHDVVRTYKAIADTTPGKVLLALGFAIGSNFAISFSTMVISEMTQVSATTFPHTLSFLAIGMIPVMIVGVGAVFTSLSMLSIPLVFFVSSIEKETPGFFTFLLARKFERPARLYPIATYLFQLSLYGIVGAVGFHMFLIFINAYGKDIDVTIRKTIYNYDMYPGTECRNMPGYRYAALGDENYILAIMVKDDFHFEKPRKCALKDE